MAKKVNKHKRTGTGFPRAVLVRVAQDLNDVLGLEPEINVTRPDSSILKEIKEAIKYVDPEVDELTEETWDLIAKLEDGATKASEPASPSSSNAKPKTESSHAAEAESLDSKELQKRNSTRGAGTKSFVALSVDAFKEIDLNAEFSKKQLAERLTELSRAAGKDISENAAYHTVGWLLSVLKALGAVVKTGHSTWLRRK